jgi:hypothetical protein
VEHNKALFKEGEGTLEENKIIGSIKVTDTTEELKAKMCKDYCRYLNDPDMTQEVLDTICEECPLTRL